MNTLTKGRFGEYVAMCYVMAKGLQIIAVNYRTGPYELDIIAREGDELVFIEVKRRKESLLYTVNDAITWSKRVALIKAANRFLAENDMAHLTGRFDVAYLIENTTGGYELQYIENAFY